MMYLDASKEGNYQPDFVTNLVAIQSSELISSFGYDAKVIPHETETSMKLYINNDYLARIVEGCNAISIIILFIAFIVSFAEGLKKTMLYLFAGIAIIYAVNIIRIAILSIAIYKYPSSTETLHGIVFPAIIYGMVFILWMIWIKMLPKSNTSNE